MTSIVYFKYLGAQGALKAGEYEFRKDATMRQVLDTLVQGRSIDHKVTFAEGLTSQQIVERIKPIPICKATSPRSRPRERCFPTPTGSDRDDTRQDIIERMQVSQAKFLAKMWEERDPDIVVQTPEEALILASIVEKETGRADERPRIAGVYQNRLAEEHSPAIRSDHHLRIGGRQGRARPSHPAGRARPRHTIQYLQDQWACRRGRSPIRGVRRSRLC